MHVTETEVCAPAVKFPIAFPGIERYEDVFDKNVPVLNKYVVLRTGLGKNILQLY